MSKVSLLDVVSTINDAGMLISALTPLVHEAMSVGDTEVSAEAVAHARARLVMNIESLDAMISRAGQTVG
jgi:hypothetical protein